MGTKFTVSMPVGPAVKVLRRKARPGCPRKSCRRKPSPSAAPSSTYIDPKPTPVVPAKICKLYVIPTVRWLNVIVPGLLTLKILSINIFVRFVDKCVPC